MPLDALAPDQRAVLQLVLQRGRSYTQIAELLKISEDAVRARAHSGLDSLAPEVELPADKVAALGDFLLGQQNGKPRQAARRLLARPGPAREWAESVSAALGDVGGAAVAEIPALRTPAGAAATAAEPAAAIAVAEPEVAEGAAEDPVAAGRDAPRPRPRPLRADPAAVAEPSAPGDAPRRPARPSSRLGGALLIGLLAILAIAVPLWLFVFKGDDKKSGTSASASASASATPTATAVATPTAVGQIGLTGSKLAPKAGAIMKFYSAQSQLAFTLEGTGVPASRSKEAYAIWLVGPGSKAQRLGYAAPVAADGKLGTTGPRQEDVAKFAGWLGTYKRVVVSRDTSQTSRQPGPIVLSGKLPTSGK